MRLIAAVRDWLDAERYRLPLWLPVFMGTGVLVYYALRFEPAVWLGPAILVPLLAAAVAWREARWVLAPLAAMALGFASAQVATARAPPLETDLPYHAVTVSGTIVAVEMLPGGRRIRIQPAFLDDAAEPLRRSVRLRLRANDDTKLDSGDSMRVRAVVRIPPYPSYPGAWDTQRAAFYTGLGAAGYAIGPAERTAQATSTGPAGFVQMLRETIARRVMAVIPDSSGAISVGFLTGIATGIPTADYAAFRDSGLMHLLSVSGLHLAIVMGFALVAVRVGFALRA
jgi:competence protein ComEC